MEEAQAARQLESCMPLQGEDDVTTQTLELPGWTSRRDAVV
jgi:hypothetical protein